MTHKTKIIFVIALLFLLGAGTAFVLVSLEVERVGTTLESRVKVIADQLAKEQKFTELTELVVSTEAERGELNKYILSEADTISFLAEVERIGAEHGVELNTNSLNATEKEGEPNTLTVSFTIVGEEPLVFRMLTILESLPYESQVQQISYKLDEEARMDINLSLTLF